MKILKRYLGIILVLAILAAGRFFLLGKGCLDDTDELPFLELLRQSDLLWRGDVDAWNKQVIGLWSTYPETAIRLFQSIFLNFYADWRHLDPISNDALIVMGVFNWIISLLIAWLFYLILLRIGFNHWISALGVLLYGTLLNSNLYIRHILPYDASLLFHLIAVFILLKDKLVNRDVLFSGLFCALGYYTYHGNFTFLFISWFILMFLSQGHWKVKLSNTFLLALPSLLMLLFLEYLSRQSGKGFFEHTILFSGTIYHGSTDEVLSYVFKYFYLVEKGWGLFVLLLFFVGSTWAIYRRELFSLKLKLFLFTGVATYLLFGIYNQITDYMVFYGRVFHMYYPFIVVGALSIIVQFRKMLVPLAVVGAIVNFGLVIKGLNQIGYPRSMVFEYHLFDNTDKTQFFNESKAGIVYNHKLRYFHEYDWDVPEYRLPKPKAYYVPKDSLILLNFAFFFHYPDDFIESYRKFHPPANAHLLVERPHFMSHPAYTFEYCTRTGRQFFLDKQLKIGIYEIKSPPLVE